MIWGYPYFWKHPCMFVYTLHVSPRTPRSTNINWSCISSRKKIFALEGNDTLELRTLTSTNQTSDRKIQPTQPKPYQIISQPKSSSIFKSLRTSCSPCTLCSTMEKNIWAFSMWGLLSLGSTSTDLSLFGPLIGSTGGCEWYVLNMQFQYKYIHKISSTMNMI